MQGLAPNRPQPAFRFAGRARQGGATHQAVAEGAFELSGGYAFPRCLPDISAEAAVAAARHRTETMQYSDVFGLADLRDRLAAYLRADGIGCSRDEIMIVNGAKHGLDLVCRVFLEPGDRVIVSAPTYMTALSILRTHEVAFVPVGQDDQGMKVDELEATLQAMQGQGEPLPKLLFEVPDFHNPTGITMSLERRKRLVLMAERYGFVIVEDDPYRRIRFEGEPVPPIKSLDRSGVVITLGTASKIFAPGLRTGWVVADPDILGRMAAQKADGGTSPLSQRILAELLDGKRVGRQIETVIGELRVHRDAMTDALLRYMPAAAVTKPQGGYYLWAVLPGNIDADALADLAAENGVMVYPGSLCFAEAPTQSALRLCFSFEEPSRITDAVKKLGECLSVLATASDSGRHGASSQVSQRMRTF